METTKTTCEECGEPYDAKAQQCDTCDRFHSSIQQSYSCTLTENGYKKSLGTFRNDADDARALNRWVRETQTSYGIVRDCLYLEVFRPGPEPAYTTAYLSHYTLMGEAYGLLETLDFLAKLPSKDELLNRFKESIGHQPKLEEGPETEHLNNIIERLEEALKHLKELR